MIEIPETPKVVTNFPLIFNLVDILLMCAIVVQHALRLYIQLMKLELVKHARMANIKQQNVCQSCMFQFQYSCTKTHIKLTNGNMFNVNKTNKTQDR